LSASRPCARSAPWFPATTIARDAVRPRRVALEREKNLTLRAIKELEFDKAMGKLSESDWQEMSARLRVRAAGLMRQLDAGSGYREQIERDVTKRLGVAPASATTSATRGNFCRCGLGTRRRKVLKRVQHKL
jgi:hypothetical protein